tara:strand:+ start:11254 stop:11439 length:186 start_codon:yes stop_codon:yes gene_type:complete
MAITPNSGMSDADVYFNIEDDILRETIRQIFDNTRKLQSDIGALKKRVRDLEDREDKEGML